MYSSAVSVRWVAFAALFGWALPLSAEAPPRGSDKASPKTVSAAAETASAAPKAAEIAQPLPLSEAARAATAKRHPESVADLRAIQEQVRKVVDRARQTVVAVRIGGAVGSGVVVSEDGLVLTAGHVAMKPNLPVTFFFQDGSRARGMTLGLNGSLDSGMLRITDPGPWPHSPVAAAEDLQRGDWVVTLGQPNGFFKDRKPPVRLGRVLSVDDEVVQTDCTLVGGDSGGPLLNLQGEVVGIHSRISRSIISNFHVPISVYYDGWERLLAGQVWGTEKDTKQASRTRPLLGLAGEIGDGPCRVTQVFPGMPAARAGVKEGDIVRSYDGETINTFADLARKVLNSKPSKVVTLDIERDGEPMRIEVRLGRIAAGFPGSPRSKS